VIFGLLASSHTQKGTESKSPNDDDDDDDDEKLYE
jgi:hypothetical protein